MTLNLDCTLESPEEFKKWCCLGPTPIDSDLCCPQYHGLGIRFVKAPKMILLCCGRHVDLGPKGEDSKILAKYKDILLAVSHLKVELTVSGALFAGGSWTGA